MEEVSGSIPLRSTKVDLEYNVLFVTTVLHSWQVSVPLQTSAVPDNDGPRGRLWWLWCALPGAKNNSCRRALVGLIRRLDVLESRPTFLPVSFQELASLFLK